MQTEPAAGGHRAGRGARPACAPVSVSDKRGLVDFARGLAELGVEIVSTGGTARELADEGIESAPWRTTRASPRSSTAG